MLLNVSDDLMIGLTREATARSTTVDLLADLLLRSIVQDKLFNAVIDDEDRLPRRHRTGHRAEVRMTLQERRAQVMKIIDENTEITIQKLGVYPHLWIKAIKSLVKDGTIKVERRYAAGNYRRAFYSKVVV